MVEKLLSQNISDEELEKSLEALDGRVKNDPFWYYVHDLEIIRSHTNKRVIEIETYDDGPDGWYKPDFVRFWWFDRYR